MSIGVKTRFFLFSDFGAICDEYLGIFFFSHLDGFGFMYIGLLLK